MPELPEVETIVNYLRKKVLGRTFIDVWTDFQRVVKRPKNLPSFEKEIKNKKIQNIRRRGKNIIFRLSGGKSLLIHQKLTGHLLYGTWNMKRETWISNEGGALNEPVNRFIHLMFWLDDGNMLALSDLRKFAKVELWDTKELEKSEEMGNLGPEPLEKNFTLEKFKEIIRKKNGKIKQVLIDQNVIAGIGNIYSDEILWEARVYPLRNVSGLSEKELEAIYLAMKKILRKAVELQGASFSDYRLPSGKKGGYQEASKVYRQEGKPCQRCETKIKRIKISGRSAHYCPRCQK